MNTNDSETSFKLSYLKTILEDKDNYLHDVRLVDEKTKQLSVIVRKDYSSIHIFKATTHVHLLLSTDEEVKLRHLLRNTRLSNESRIVTYLESLVSEQLER